MTALCSIIGITQDSRFLHLGTSTSRALRDVVGAVLRVSKSEQYICDLPLAEDNEFDRKSSQTLIDYSTGQGSDKKRRDLSIDVSAFANSGGGFLIFGVNNAGVVDGGVPIRLKHNGTYDWLDSVVGSLVDPVLRGYRIKEIRSGSPESRIKSDSAIYVLQIPDSEDAPHQAQDSRYYIRLNALTIPHVIVKSKIYVTDVVHRKSIHSWSGEYERATTTRMTAL